MTTVQTAPDVTAATWPPAPWRGRVGAAPVDLYEGQARLSRPRRRPATPDQWMAIRQAYFAEQRSIAEVARLTRVSRRQVRRVLWPFSWE